MKVVREYKRVETLKSVSAQRIGPTRKQLLAFANLHNSLLVLYARVLGCARLTTKAPRNRERGVRLMNKEGALMQTSQPTPWEELYAAAVLETDPNKISERIALAQNALRDRWQNLQKVPLARDRERQQLEDAIRTLNLIRQTELHNSA